MRRKNRPSQEIVKNADRSFPEPKALPSHSFFSPNHSPKPRDSLSVLITDKEEQQILTFKRTEPENVEQFDWYMIEELLPFSGPVGRFAVHSDGVPTSMAQKSNQLQATDLCILCTIYDLFSIYKKK